MERLPNRYARVQKGTQELYLEGQADRKHEIAEKETEKCSRGIFKGKNSTVRKTFACKKPR